MSTPWVMSFEPMLKPSQSLENSSATIAMAGGSASPPPTQHRISLFNLVFCASLQLPVLVGFEVAEAHNYGSRLDGSRHCCHTVSQFTHKLVSLPRLQQVERMLPNRTGKYKLDTHE